jgi:Protein of unknown function DUF262
MAVTQGHVVNLLIRVTTDTPQGPIVLYLVGMEMTSGRRAIDKIFKRRNRYEIPDWQREGDLWDRAKKQALIDSILRGWKLPKFYFVKTSPDQYLVEDGQQRLLAIYEFCDNELALSTASAKQFGGRFYNELPQTVADAIDDFEIEYDLIEGATDEELKEFFQRLQAGLPLTSSEKLNAVHGKLRDYVRSISKDPFFKETIAIADTRYSHFDIAAKVASIELEGLETGLRFEDIKAVFESSTSFSSSSAVAKRIRAALAFLHSGFKDRGDALRTRTVVQSLITLTCKLIQTGQSKGREKDIRNFFEAFTEELSKQVEMGQAATDSDYVTFQRSVNANVKGGAKTRHQILLRKLFNLSPALADVFDPSIVAESGVSGRIATLGDSISHLIDLLNKKYSANGGEDLFKATNKTSQAQIRIRRPIGNVEGYKILIDDLYFLFRESVGSRLQDNWPTSFSDINDLRTDLRHDIDHGEAGKVRSKRRRIGRAFAKYAGSVTPETMEPSKMPLMQANLLSAVEGDLRSLLSKTP